MKKIIVTVFLTICLAIMMVGCGDKNNSATAPTSTPQASASPSSQATASPAADNDPADDNDMDRDDTDGDRKSVV